MGALGKERTALYGCDRSPRREKQGEYDSSRYAPCDAPVTPRQYPRLYEQEPTSGEGGENERFTA